MKVALTAWENRISPVFDAARTLLIADIENGEIVNRRYDSLFPEMSARLAARLKDLGVEVLICGAISQLPAAVIEAGGVQLIPFIGGNIEDVLTSYAKGTQIVSVFSMPGCGGRQRRQRGRAFFLNEQKEVRTMPRGDKTGPGGKGPGSGRGQGPCGGGQGAGQSGQGPGRGEKGQGQGPGQGSGRGAGRGSGQGRGNR